MKPMEYTPLTPCHCDKTDEPHYAEQGGLMRYVGDNAAYSKHLTDAECAAEMWKMQSALHGLNAPHAELAQRTHLWHRFATTPSIWEDQ